MNKGQITLTSIVLTMLVSIAIFTGMFLYMQQQATSNGVQLDSKYNDTYTRLQNSSNSLDNNLKNMRDSVSGIKEADNIYSVAWNGLKGLGNVLKLPISFIDTSIETVSAILIPLDIIPKNYKTLLVMGIITVVLLVVLAILKGDPKL